MKGVTPNFLFLFAFLLQIDIGFFLAGGELKQCILSILLTLSSKVGPDSAMWYIGNWKSWRVLWFENLWELKLMQVGEEVL